MNVAKSHISLFNYPFLIIFLFLLLAYLPVFLPFFHLKNDLVSQNLPTRFFISESIYSKTFPWWNPYMNYGVPQYGDMNNGYWNPLLWLTAKLFGYNVLTITLEEMLYILIGGWGIYKTALYFKIPQNISILCSLSYMSGGYILGHIQHFCWITGTAFFPFILYFFLRSIKQPILKNFIAGGVFSFLFISSTHPGLIIGAIYFFAFLIAHMIFISVKNKTAEWKLIIKASLFFGLTSALFSIIVIASNIEVLQHITRGNKVSIQETLSHPTTLQSYLSLFFPFAVNEGNFFQTDISMRNMSLGVALLPGLFILIKYINPKKNWLLYLMLLFFVLLAAGGNFKLFAYNFLPYLGYVRLNGEFAYFPYVVLLLGSTWGLAKLALTDEPLVKKILNRMLLFFLVSLVISIGYIFITKDSFLFNTSINTVGSPKQLFNSLTFGDLLLLSIGVQSASIFFSRRFPTNSASFLTVGAINLIFISWGCLPYTGVGQMPRKEVQAIIDIIPKGINKPSQSSIGQNYYLDKKYDTILGSVAFYSKQVGYPTQLPYPVVLNQAELFYRDHSLVQFINKRSFLFLASDTTIKSETTQDSTLIKIISFTPASTSVEIQNNAEYKYLVFLQNNYPRWQVVLDNIPVKHFTVFKSFIGIEIPSGTHKVKFIFNTNSLQSILWVNILILVFGLFLLTQNKYSGIRLFQK